MSKLYLHIGFGKCGSSALQTALTLNHTLHAADRTIKYAAIIPRQLVISGKQLKEYADCQPHGYANSIPALATFYHKKNVIEKFRKALGGDNDWILSQEGWNRRADEFTESGLLKQLGREVHVIAYVRPQVEWLNSACWQWFYWHDRGNDPSASLSRCSTHTMDWEHWLSQWEKVPYVRSVTVRLLPRDIFSDFLSLLHVDPDSTLPIPPNNTTLPLEAISLLSHMGLTRKHTSSEVDFILQNHLELSGKKPWAVPPDKAREVIEDHRASNLRLKERLNEKSAAMMDSDTRWWDPSYYRSHVVDHPKQTPIPPAQTKKWLLQAMRGLVSTQKELSDFRKERLLEQWTKNQS